MAKPKVHLVIDNQAPADCHRRENIPEKLRIKVFSLQLHHRQSHPKFGSHAYCHHCKKWFDRFDLDRLASGRRFSHSVMFLAARGGLNVEEKLNVSR